MQDNLKKLESTSRTGDFVHDHQNMAEKEGFKNVSKKWYDKTVSFETGLKSLAEGKAKTHDILASLSEMKPAVDDVGNFVMEYKDGRKFKPTQYAIGQMGSWAETGTWFVNNLCSIPLDNKEQIRFSRDKQDAETLAQALSNGFRRVEQNKKFLWRTREDGTLRAMLTESYAIVNNIWFLESLQKILPEGRLSHWKGDCDTIYGNILIPDTLREEEDSEYGGLLSVSNCEIGIRRISSIPSIFRAICMNGCIWDQMTGVGIKKVHRGTIVLADLFSMIKSNLEKQIPLLPQGIDLFLKTKEQTYIGSMKPVFAQLALDYKLPKVQAAGLLTAFAVEPSNSLFGVINAVTRAGQKFDNDVWVKFDNIGGELLTENWSSLVSRSNSLRMKEVDAVFSSVV